MLFDNRRTNLATSTRKARRARIARRPTVEVLEGRALLAAQPPAVIFQIDGRVNGGHSPVSVLTDTLNWHDRFDATVDVGTGLIQKFGDASITASDGSIHLHHEDGYRYTHKGGWPFILDFAGASTSENVSIYVLGGPGTPFTYTAKASGTAEATRAPGFGNVRANADGYDHPGADYFWNVNGGEYRESWFSSGITTEYAGRTYSEIFPVTASSAIAAYAISERPGGPYIFDGHIVYDVNISVKNLAVPPPDIKVSIASMASRDVVGFNYEIDGNLLGRSVKVGIYRSSDNKFDPTQDKLIGMTSLQDTSQGIHFGTWKGQLPIDLERKYVLVVADPENEIAEVDKDPFNEDNTAHFRTWNLAAITHGYQLVGENPSWVNEMKSVLESIGYDSVITHFWAAASSYPVPMVTVFEGKLLANKVKAEAFRIAHGSGFEVQDVVNIHMIGHSRGAVVVSQAFHDLGDASNIENAIIPPSPIRDSFWQMTSLDAHPASKATLDAFSALYDPNDKKLRNPVALLVKRYREFNLLANDPDVDVPMRVDSADSYFQNNSVFLVRAAVDKLINLHGLEVPRSVNTYVQESGISHTAMQDWYTRNVLLKLKKKAIK